jgi:hypothetical protein
MAMVMIRPMVSQVVAVHVLMLSPFFSQNAATAPTHEEQQRLTTLKRIAVALRAPLAAFIADSSNIAEPSVPAPSEGYDLGEYE